MLGKRFFAGNTELVSPGCCHDKQTLRQERLEKGRTVILYHQTDHYTADLIQNSGKMLRGSDGTVGGAIYFALTPRETQWKTLRRGVMLECEVQLGHMLKVDVSDQCQPPYKNVTFAHMMNPSIRGTEVAALNLDPVPGDSILLNRGNDRHTGNACEGLPSGPEVVVFSWQQVQIKNSYVEKDDDHWAKPLGWFPDKVKTAFADHKAASITRTAFEDVFYEHVPELQAYRGHTPKDHLQKADELLEAKHIQWLAERKHSAVV